MNAKPREREFELVEIDADHAKGAAFNMLFAIWRFHTHYEPYRRCVHWLGLLAQRHPGGLGMLHVVEPTAIPPDAPTRRLFAEVMRNPSVRHYSVVHTARGFKAASIRAVVATSFALSRTHAAHSVHSNVDEAAGWVAEQQRRLGRSETREQIARVTEALRALHRERYPGDLHAP
ncbi:MAG TPA: hypothetical protein VMG12_02100 [Polyangiaceae bacterium]|nr:hypothetical protein [Polyangiaceae bacterium]